MPSWNVRSDRRGIIAEWLGDGFKVRIQRVEADKWRSQKWRTEFLCRKVRLNRYHVYDEPAPEDKRLIVFASPHA